jgi:hypothetical protein
MQNICFAMKLRHAPHQAFGIDLNTLLESHRSKKMKAVSDSNISNCKPEQAMGYFGRAWIKFGSQRER